MTGASDDAELLVVCGPTAAGKSAVAEWIAERRPTTVVSADSRQIYRGFDVGTAKPSAAERARVPHSGVDVIEPTERYSAARWADDAERWIADAHAAGRLPLLVGGTGLYLRALIDGLFVEPALDAGRRAALAAALAPFDTPELARWTRALDPPRAALGRTQLLRSVEIALLAGRRLSDLQQERPRPRRWRARYLLVDPGPALANRIVGRLDAMLDHGWPDEVLLLMRSVPADAPAWNATGYATMRELATGSLSRAAARERILIATRQYAKRQRTWFRHQLATGQVTPLDPTSASWKDHVAYWLGGVQSPREARG